MDLMEKIYADAKDHASQAGIGNYTEYMVEHWLLENSAFLGTTVLEVEHWLLENSAFLGTTVLDSEKI